MLEPPNVDGSLVTLIEPRQFILTEKIQSLKSKIEETIFHGKLILTNLSSHGSKFGRTAFEVYWFCC